MRVGDSWTLSRSVEERDRLAESFSSIGCAFALFPSLTLNINRRKRDPLRSVAFFNPASGMTLTVAWNLFAFLNACIAIIISSLLNCASIPSNALSRLNQKFISCDVVPDEKSLVSLVTAWMALIHEST